MIISAILIFKFDRDEIGVVDLFFISFPWITQEFVDISVLVPGYSIGINCYSVPPQRNVYSESQHKSHLFFQYLSLIPEKDQSIYIYSIYIEFIFRYI